MYFKAIVVNKKGIIVKLFIPITRVPSYCEISGKTLDKYIRNNNKDWRWKRTTVTKIKVKNNHLSFWKTINLR